MFRLTILALMIAAAASGQMPDWRNGILLVEANGRSPGTGFIVALRDGLAYVVTCAHVVAGDGRPMVTFNADREKRQYPAELRDADRGTDLALLVVKAPPGDAVAVEPRPGPVPSEGTDVLAAGYPGETGARFAVLRGAISAVSDTGLSISPAPDEGFSGGPVVSDGRVIGVVSEHTRTFAKAIPRGVVERYLQGQRVEWVGPGTPRENLRDGLTYVWIPAGKFMMGCSPGDTDCRDNERPQREVSIAHGFWMGQTEVTQAAYEKVMDANPSHSKGVSLPVEQVDWRQAGEYCAKAGLRLPTEAEWEYAARAGNPQARYGQIAGIAWYKGNSSQQTHDVKQKEPNAWGVYDMLGNVYEWTADIYSGTTDRVLRGGAWVSNPQDVRVSFRIGDEPTLQYLSIGFRCAGELRQ